MSSVSLDHLQSTWANLRLPALRELSKNGIIHADICDANLVLGDGAAHEIRPGVLIDFDYAFFSGKDRTKSATGVKTVSLFCDTRKYEL